jgi:hypothetical protein
MVALVVPSLVAAALAIGAGLSASVATAATTPVGGFSLLAVFVYVADEHPALVAGVGPPEAGVVRLYGVVLMLGGWVRWVR